MEKYEVNLQECFGAKYFEVYEVKSKYVNEDHFSTDTIFAKKELAEEYINKFNAGKLGYIITNIIWIE